MKEELKRIFGLDTSDSFVYSPGLFDMRLKEELLRSHRQQIPFLYLQIPTKDFNALGMELRGDATRAWKIAVLTLFSFRRAPGRSPSSRSSPSPRRWTSRATSTATRASASS